MVWLVRFNMFTVVTFLVLNRAIIEVFHLGSVIAIPLTFTDDLKTFATNRIH